MKFTITIEDVHESGKVRVDTTPNPEPHLDTPAAHVCRSIEKVLVKSGFINTLRTTAKPRLRLVTGEENG